MNRRLWTVMAAAGLMAGAVTALPSVSGVSMQQVDGAREMRIAYTLSEDAIITLGIETNGIALPDREVTELSGDVCKVVSAGECEILWHMDLDWPENVTANARPKVTAWPTHSPPDVVVIDVTAGSEAESYSVGYYPSLEALPYGGVQNSTYKCAFIVLRKIPRGSFVMGWLNIGTRQMTFSKDFYMGVYEITQGQYYRVTGLAPSTFNEISTKMIRPVTHVTYNDIRGSTSDGIDWPSTTNVVAAGTFLDLLRDRTGFAAIDLPTDAQWEYACRAGTRTTYNDGNMEATAYSASNKWMNALGRYSYNGGLIGGTTLPDYPDCPPSQGPAIVGSYQPNAWGLYDMHGNVLEWCRDWYTQYVPANDTDPSGPESGSYRVERGGSWYYGAGYSRSGYRSYRDPSAGAGSNGFRIMMEIE